MPIALVMFSKMLGEFPVAEAARRIKGLGFEGVDLTVRPGGHVLPERVATDLPEAVKAIRGEGLSVPMITTAITRAGDPHAEADPRHGRHRWASAGRSSATGTPPRGASPTPSTGPGASWTGWSGWPSRRT